MDEGGWRIEDNGGWMMMDGEEEDEDEDEDDDDDSDNQVMVGLEFRLKSQLCFDHAVHAAASHSILCKDWREGFCSKS